MFFKGMCVFLYKTTKKKDKRNNQIIVLSKNIKKKLAIKQRQQRQLGTEVHLN